MIDLLAQQNPEIARLGAKDVLPDWLIAEKRQRIGHELPRAFQLTTDCGNEDERAWRQGRKDADCARLSNRIRQPASGTAALRAGTRRSAQGEVRLPQRFALPASIRSDILRRMQPPIPAHPNSELDEPFSPNSR